MIINCNVKVIQQTGGLKGATGEGGEPAVKSDAISGPPPEEEGANQQVTA